MPEHDCKQETTIQFIQERLQNGQLDFRELRIDIKKLLEQNARLREDVAALKEKARNWGAIFGATAALAVQLLITIIKAVIK